MPLSLGFESDPRWSHEIIDAFLEHRRNVLQVAEESLINSRNAMKNYCKFRLNFFPTEPGWNSEEGEIEKPDSS